MEQVTIRRPGLAARCAAEIDEIRGCFARLPEINDVIAAAAETMIEALRSGGKVMFCGNGGSAADSQHLAAELLGRYLRDRRPLPALALTVDTSVLTAVSNDFGYADVFVRQVRGIGRAGDVLVGLSTSGRSENVVRALQAAREMEIRTIGMTGEQGAQVAEHCDICLKVPAERTNRIQEMHIAVGHILCGFIEEALC